MRVITLFISLMLFMHVNVSHAATAPNCSAQINGHYPTEDQCNNMIGCFFAEDCRSCGGVNYQSDCASETFDHCRWGVNTSGGAACIAREIFNCNEQDGRRWSWEGISSNGTTNHCIPCEGGIFCPTFTDSVPACGADNLTGASEGGLYCNCPVDATGTDNFSSQDGPYSIEHCFTNVDVPSIWQSSCPANTTISPAAPQRAHWEVGQGWAGVSWTITLPPAENNFWTINENLTCTQRAIEVSIPPASGSGSAQRICLRRTTAGGWDWWNSGSVCNNIGPFETRNFTIADIWATSRPRGRQGQPFIGWGCGSDSMTQYLSFTLSDGVIAPQLLPLNTALGNNQNPSLQPMYGPHNEYVYVYHYDTMGQTAPEQRRSTWFPNTLPRP